MLTFLAKILGPDRAVTVYVFFQRWGIGLALVLAFVVGMGLFMVLSTRERLEHVAYVTADVTATTPINGDARNGLYIDLRLPSGQTLQLNEAQGPIIANIAQTACVEHRRDNVDGSDHYRLRLDHRCAQ